MTAAKTRNPVGWGYVEDALSEAERDSVMKTLSMGFGDAGLEYRARPAVGDVPLTAPRLTVPQSLTDLVACDQAERLLHAIGRSFKDLARLRSGETLPAPDAIARPGDRTQLARVLEWADHEGLAVIPFGGGSSVVGGVTPDNLSAFNGCVSVDLQQMNRVLSVSERDRVAHVEAGILGPDLDAALKPHGLTMRYYPQSYFHSTAGGWIATRGAGHYSTLRAKIEDQVEALSVLLPDGRSVETRPLPASSVGPDPNRLWCGSEGFLGVITDARLRVQPIPEHRATAAIGFETFEAALEAGREIVQAGLWPAQLRILDPDEHAMSAALAGSTASGALMILGFESPTMPVDGLMSRAQELARGHGGQPRDSGKSGGESVQAWREAFFRQPYVRDVLMDYAVIADTFETAVPWSALPDFYRSVREATVSIVEKVCGGGMVTCRTTHAYPDGVCLYFSFNAAGRHDALVDQWQQIKAAASEAVMAGGGTISHHHAMGRDHKEWARQEIPAAYRSAMRAAKRDLDPSGVMNPGLWFED